MKLIYQSHHTWKLSCSGQSLLIHWNGMDGTECLLRPPPDGFLFVFLEYSCFTRLCSILLYSKANQPHAYTDPLFSGFPSHLGHHRALNRVPCAVPWVLTVCVCVTHSAVSDSCNPTDYSPPDSSVHGILQARILQWVATSFSRGSSQSRDQTQVSCIANRFFTV